METSHVLVRNEPVRPMTFYRVVLPTETDRCQVHESTWKVLSNYQLVASDMPRNSSFPPVFRIRLRTESSDASKLISCRLLDEGDVLKDVLGDNNVLDANAALIVSVMLQKTEFLFKDFQPIKTEKDFEFESARQAIDPVRFAEFVNARSEHIRTTMTILIPCSTKMSSPEMSEPPSVFDKVFNNPLIMDRIISYAVRLRMERSVAQADDIKSVLAVNKCWRKSTCRVLESNGATTNTMKSSDLDEFIKSLPGGFPLDSVRPYHLFTVCGNEEFNGRVLRFLARFPPAGLTCNIDGNFNENLMSIVQFSRLKTFDVYGTFNRETLQKMQQMLANTIMLRRFEIVCTGYEWIPDPDDGLVLPKSLKCLRLTIPPSLLNVISDQNQFAELKHFSLTIEQYEDDEDSYEAVENEDSDTDYDTEDEEDDGYEDVESGDDDENIEVEENENVIDVEFENLDEYLDHQNDEEIEVELGENLHQNHGLNEDERYSTAMLELLPTQLGKLLKSMGPSLVSLCMLMFDVKDIQILLPHLPNLNSLVFHGHHLTLPPNVALPSLQYLDLRFLPLGVVSDFLEEGRSFANVTEFKLHRAWNVAVVTQMASVLPNCSKLSVSIVSDHTSSAIGGEVFSKMPRLDSLEIMFNTGDIIRLEELLTGLSIEQLSKLRQTIDSWDSTVLGTNSITNLKRLKKLVLVSVEHPVVQVTEFLFKITFMKMAELVNIVLHGELKASEELVREWERMGRCLNQDGSYDGVL